MPINPHCNTSTFEKNPPRPASSRTTAPPDTTKSNHQNSKQK